MLDENDIKEIAQILSETIKRDVTPTLNDILKNQTKKANKHDQEARIKELEHEIKLLKKIIHKYSEDLQQLKRQKNG